MFSRKFSSNIRRKKRMIISSIILLVVFLGIGYSVFTTNLGINGTLKVDKYDQTLYGVLEKAAKVGTYAKEYTGEHQDSMAGVGTKKIYHWYAAANSTGNTRANEILDKNNVIFADHCWQMIRTTDTGGVKMIYNGEVENDQCLNTRGEHVGISSREVMIFSENYYYGTSYTYDKENDAFSIAGTITTGEVKNNEYTCASTSPTDTCEELYLVDKLHTEVSDGDPFNAYILDGYSEYSQFGGTAYNQLGISVSDAGYMYNKVYMDRSKDYSIEKVITITNLATKYYYADSYEYISSENKYSLVDPYKIESEEDYESLVGKYTCHSVLTSPSDRVLYIYAVEGSTLYAVEIADGHDLNYYSDVYTFGDGYINNGNDTYTITNAVTINRTDYQNYYEDIIGKYVCKNAVNNICNEVWHVNSSTTNQDMSYIKSSDLYKYATSFSYNSTTNKYTLNDENVIFWDNIDSENMTSLNTHHYTCFNTSGECEKLAYVHNANDVGKLMYILLEDGKSIQDALTEMLSDENVNSINSVMKTAIDAWYARYMIEHASYLEDTIFCNDRTIKSLGGWDPTSGDVTEYLQFKNYNLVKDLSCNNMIDMFSTQNSKAKLTYPVGLLTKQEAYLLNNSILRKTGNQYWLFSPRYVTADTTFISMISLSGGHTNQQANLFNGIRPVISLKPGTEYASGTGSMVDPYVVE